MTKRRLKVYHAIVMSRTAQQFWAEQNHYRHMWILECLHPDPNQRPSFRELFERLSGRRQAYVPKKILIFHSHQVHWFRELLKNNATMSSHKARLLTDILKWRVHDFDAPYDAVGLVEVLSTLRTRPLKANYTVTLKKKHNKHIKRGSYPKYKVRLIQ